MEINALCMWNPLAVVPPVYSIYMKGRSGGAADTCNIIKNYPLTASN